MAGHNTWPAIATDANGNALVVGTYNNGEGIWARRFSASGQPLGDEWRVDAGPLAGETREIATAACGPDGRFTIAWTYMDGRVMAPATTKTRRRWGRSL